MGSKAFFAILKWLFLYNRSSSWFCAALLLTPGEHLNAWTQTRPNPPQLKRLQLELRCFKTWLFIITIHHPHPIAHSYPIAPAWHSSREPLTQNPTRMTNMSAALHNPQYSQRTRRRLQPTVREVYRHKNTLLLHMEPIVVGIDCQKQLLQSGLQMNAQTL